MVVFPKMTMLRGAPHLLAVTADPATQPRVSGVSDVSHAESCGPGARWRLTQVDV